MKLPGSDAEQRGSAAKAMKVFDRFADTVGIERFDEETVDALGCRLAHIMDGAVRCNHDDIDRAFGGAQLVEYRHSVLDARHLDIEKDQMGPAFLTGGKCELAR